MDTVKYRERVFEHLDANQWRGEPPSHLAMAAARVAGIGPRKFAAYWMRRHA